MSRRSLRRAAFTATHAVRPVCVPGRDTLHRRLHLAQLPAAQATLLLEVALSFCGQTWRAEAAQLRVRGLDTHEPDRLMILSTSAKGFVLNRVTRARKDPKAQGEFKANQA